MFFSCLFKPNSVKIKEEKTKASLNRKNGMIPGAGNSLWPRSNRSWKDHGKDSEASGDSGKAIEALGDSGTEAETSGDSGTEIETSGDSDQEVATEITDSRTKARNGVLIKHSVIEVDDLYGKTELFGNMELNFFFPIQS